MPAAPASLARAGFDLASLDPADRSMAENLAVLPLDLRQEVLDSMTEAEARAFEWDWEFWARPDQKQPPEFRSGEKKVLLIRAGRGYGKTRTGAEVVRDRVEGKDERGPARRLALIGPTAGDVRDVMVEGETGLLSVFPPSQRPKYEPSKRRITFHTGAVATTFSADEPERLRGPQHDFIWGDEPASWRYGEDAWDNAEFGLRLGSHPQAVLTGTPKPLKWLTDLAADEETVEVRGSTYRNLANLAPTFIRRILKRYEGTRLGLQELYAEFLEEVEGALWTRLLLEETRIRPTWDEEGYLVLPPMRRIVVAVDPSGSSSGAETGIVVVGKDEDERGYVLDDVSVQGTPEEWARASVQAFHDWEADRIVGEKNFGGEMVEAMVRGVERNISYKGVTASRGKMVRAEPVSQLWEQKRAHLVGFFGDLEDELIGTSFDPTTGGVSTGVESPNRLDAMVWGMTDLLVLPKKKVRVR